jgi:succinyl-CoA synthetase beta subunit
MDLREKLRYGDIRQIALMAGASYETTRSILTGRRGKRGGVRIKSIAEKFLASREELLQNINR